MIEKNCLRRRGSGGKRGAARYKTGKKEEGPPKKNNVEDK